jgi:nitrate reductase NapE component
MGPLPVNEPSWRKPAGMGLLLLAIALWAVVVVTLVEGMGLSGWASGLAFAAGGFAWLWLFPMKRLLLWMETGRWR